MQMLSVNKPLDTGSNKLKYYLLAPEVLITIDKFDTELKTKTTQMVYTLVV